MENNSVQPDFTKVFFDYFGMEPELVEYRIRRGAEFLHDLAFFSSLVHDARVIPSKITTSKNRVSIPIERDRWESGASNNELHAIDSVITIYPVVSIEFQGIEPSSSDQHWNDYVWASEEYRMRDSLAFRLVFGADEGRIIVEVNKENLEVVVRDLEDSK